jgi:hypothetical protein
MIYSRGELDGRPALVSPKAADEEGPYLARSQDVLDEDSNSPYVQKGKFAANYGGVVGQAIKDVGGAGLLLEAQLVNILSQVLFSCEGYLWLDVRSELEVEEVGKVKDSINVPFEHIMKVYDPVERKKVVKKSPNPDFKRMVSGKRKRVLQQEVAPDHLLLN